MRKQLRPFYSYGDLKKVYSEPYDHTQWVDHKTRVGVTVGMARFWGEVDTAADLSCGDGYILTNIEAKKKIYGDVKPAHYFNGSKLLTGPIEQTIEQIPKVDLFILSETIEHVEDPDGLLEKIREKTSALILSTPINETTDSNPQHYWGWDQAEVNNMLEDAGFVPALYNELRFSPGHYNYQIWGCR